MKKYLIAAGIIIIVYLVVSGFKKGLIAQTPTDETNRQRDSRGGGGSQIGFDPTQQRKPLEPAEVKVSSIAERYADPSSIPVTKPENV